MTSCKLCDHPDRDSIELQIAKGALLRSVVSKELSMPLEDVHVHMDEHFAKVMTLSGDVSTPEDIKQLYDKRNVLQAALNNLIDRLTGYLERDSFTATETTQIVKMFQETRATVMDLAKLEGELKEEHHYTLVQFNELKALILTEFCPNCQKLAVERANELLTR